MVAHICLLCIWSHILFYDKLLLKGSDIMPLSDSQRKATNKYIEKNNLVEIKFRVAKEKRESYQANVSSLGYSSFNQFVIQAIEEKIERDSK